MELNHAEITLKSKYNLNSYYLFEDKIIVCKNGEAYSTIHLPNENSVICFYDMYYAGDGLRIIIATRNTYDLVGILDEDDLDLKITKLTK